MEAKSTLFQKQEIRKTLHQNEWWFVVTDVFATLANLANPSGSLKDMRRRVTAVAAHKPQR